MADPGGVGLDSTLKKNADFISGSGCSSLIRSYIQRYSKPVNGVFLTGKQIYVYSFINQANAIFLCSTE